VNRPGIAETALAALGRPWFAAASLAVVFGVFAARSAPMPVDDADVWWIAAAGRDALVSWSAPAMNSYSFTAPQHPWVMHELLFGLLYALGIDAVGPGFVRLVSLVLGASVVAIATLSIEARARHPSSGPLALLLIVAGCRDGLFAPRPSHASLLFPVAMAALAFRPGWSLLRTAGALALEVLWTNAHGSFPLGIVILGAAAFAEEADHTRNQRTACAGLAALATLLNPYGFDLHGLVARYLGGGDPTARIIHQHVVEFFPIWRTPAPFVNPFNAVVLALAAVLAASALARRRRVARAALALCLIALGCYQARHVTLAVVVGILLMHPELDDLCAEAGFAPLSSTRRSLLPALAPGLALGALLWSLAASRKSAAEWIAPVIGGPELWRLASELPAHANVYAPFDSAGVVLWIGAPRAVRVFYDSRNDCYPPDVAEAAFALERPDAARIAEATLDRYATRFALVPDGHAVFAALSRSAGWSIRRSDGHWAQFERNS
jgi:hypothetical protein